MTDEADEMYAKWNEQSESSCPECGEGDLSSHQEFNQFWTRWDTRSDKMLTDGDEMVLVKSKCSMCGWKGSFMYQLGPFAGYITDEEMERHEVLMEAKDEARSQAVMEGRLCFFHEVENCEDEMCKANAAAKRAHRLGLPGLTLNWPNEEEE